MTLPEIEEAILQILNSFKSPIPAHQIDDMKQLCRAGEPGIALENFATQLVEYGVGIPTAMIDRLEALGNAMGLDEKYWRWLREQAGV